jgi:hypothetical protein
MSINFHYFYNNTQHPLLSLYWEAKPLTTNKMGTQTTDHKQNDTTTTIMKRAVVLQWNENEIASAPLVTIALLTRNEWWSRIQTHSFSGFSPPCVRQEQKQDATSEVCLCRLRIGGSTIETVSLLDYLEQVVEMCSVAYAHEKRM